VYEPATPAPLLGKTGRKMEREFFPLAGLQRGRVTLRNAIRCRRNGSNELPPVHHTVTRDAIAHCHRAHYQPTAFRPRLRIAMGEHALWATTGEGMEKRRTLSAWRGWVLPSALPNAPRRVPNYVWTPGEDGRVPVLATYHLAYLFRDPSAHTPAQSDWRKVARILAGTWPEALPAIDPQPPAEWPRRAAFDTEFVIATRALIRYSLAWRAADGTPQVHVVEAADATPVPTPDQVAVIMHNAAADVPFLSMVIPGAMVSVEDTMYAHAALWPGKSEDESEVAVGTAHTLEYVGSLYARVNRWKHLSESNPREYSGADALGTWDVAMALDREFTRDPQSRAVYQLMLRCLPIISRAHHEGLRVDQAYALEALAALEARMADATLQGHMAAGWPMSVGSPAQVQHHLYTVEGMRPPAKRGPRR
jgi:uracil-DNA glycosylase family 4